MRFWADAAELTTASATRDKSLTPAISAALFGRNGYHELQETLKPSGSSIGKGPPLR
jgi:hypothetical protein